MNATQESYTATTPLFMAETEEEAVEQWHRALPDGWEADGEPSVEVADLNPNMLALYGGVQPWSTTGPIRPKTPPAYPTEKAVEEGAKALAARHGQHVGPWDDLPGHVKNWYAVTALDVLNAALPHVSQERPD